MLGNGTPSHFLYTYWESTRVVELYTYLVPTYLHTYLGIVSLRSYLPS